jgi:D-glycero-D-manno-heptose 1,7-bisphosphate phosphatase
MSAGHGLRRRRGLFLDRDGIINEERNFVSRREDFVWCAGVFDLLRVATALDLAPVVITNQSGIGRGLYGEADYQTLTQWMLAELAARGTPLAAVYHCPWHPEATITAYRGDHPWRKPNPGMIFAAAEELGLDLSDSILIGDRWLDIDAGQAAGIPHRALVGGGARDPQPSGVNATAMLSDVAAAADWLRQTAIRNR